MPALRTYPVFIWHDWEYSDDYHRVHKFLSTARNLAPPPLLPAGADPAEHVDRALAAGFERELGCVRRAGGDAEEAERWQGQAIPALHII